MNQPDRYDVIIAGAGLAGATFALAAAQSGLKVVLIDP
ncbi:MAG: FAD-binding protein, partial [Brevundimonas sp.]|nr:FAD-binding protein [Brevundimonas sp.]